MNGMCIADFMTDFLYPMKEFLVFFVLRLRLSIFCFAEYPCFIGGLTLEPLPFTCFIVHDFKMVRALWLVAHEHSRFLVYPYGIDKIMKTFFHILIFSTHNLDYHGCPNNDHSHLNHYSMQVVRYSGLVIILSETFYMRYLLTLTLLLLTLVTSAQKTDKEQWVSIFNGKDLKGWTPKIRYAAAGENWGNTFRVEQGKIVVRYDQYDAFNERFGHLFYNTPYGYYRIRLQYRFVGEQCKEGPGWAYRNSGIMVHGQTAASMGKDQDFPVSIEVQLLGGNGKDPRTTCNLCTPGTNVVQDGKLRKEHCISSNSPTYHGDQWVTAEVLVLGDSLIRHYANGLMVLEYQQPQIGGGNVDKQDVKWGIDGNLLNSGTISLQSESHPVEFRKIEILNLEGCMDPKAKNFRSYYVKNKPGSCKY